MKLGVQLSLVKSLVRLLSYTQHFKHLWIEQLLYIHQNKKNLIKYCVPVCGLVTSTHPH